MSRRNYTPKYASTVTHNGVEYNYAIGCPLSNEQILVVQSGTGHYEKCVVGLKMTKIGKTEPVVKLVMTQRNLLSNDPSLEESKLRLQRSIWRIVKEGGIKDTDYILDPNKPLEIVDAEDLLWYLKKPNVEVI